MLKFRSVKSIVKAPANTGSDNKRRIEVKKIDQENKEISSKEKFIEENEKKVLIKLIAPAIDETPAKCKEKIPKSLDKEGLKLIEVNGG